MYGLCSFRDVTQSSFILGVLTGYPLQRVVNEASQYRILKASKLYKPH